MSRPGALRTLRGISPGPLQATSGHQPSVHYCYRTGSAGPTPRLAPVTFAGRRGAAEAQHQIISLSRAQAHTASSRRCWTSAARYGSTGLLPRSRGREHRRIDLAGHVVGADVVAGHDAEPSARRRRRAAAPLTRRLGLGSIRRGSTKSPCGECHPHMSPSQTRALPCVNRCKRPCQYRPLARYWHARTRRPARTRLDP